MNSGGASGTPKSLRRYDGYDDKIENEYDDQYAPNPTSIVMQLSGDGMVATGDYNFLQSRNSAGGMAGGAGMGPESQSHRATPSQQPAGREQAAKLLAMRRTYEDSLLNMSTTSSIHSAASSELVSFSVLQDHDDTHIGTISSRLDANLSAHSRSLPHQALGIADLQSDAVGRSFRESHASPSLAQRILNRDSDSDDPLGYRAMVSTGGFHEGYWRAKYLR